MDVGAHAMWRSLQDLSCHSYPAEPDRQPAWSPDGGRIAFASDRDENDEIYVMNADGAGQTRLTNTSSDEGLPAWSPYGTRIAFNSSTDDIPDIYVINADGPGQVLPILTNRARCSQIKCPDSNGLCRVHLANILGGKVPD